MTNEKNAADKSLMIGLGGATKVAVMLGYPKRGGAQRVQNWFSRGIPSKVKLDNPQMFTPAQTP